MPDAVQSEAPVQSEASQDDTAGVPLKSVKTASTASISSKHTLPFHMPSFHPQMPHFKSLFHSPSHPDGPSWWWHHHSGAKVWHPHVMPRFDMYETSAAFVVEGELPGSRARAHMTLEWMQPRTLLIQGTLDSTGIFGPQPPEDDREAGAAKPEATNGTEEISIAEPTEEDVKKFKEVSEEDTNDIFATSGSEVTKGAVRSWMSERCIGPYFRSFTFPSAVDEKSIKAVLRDGLLTVTIPKDADLETKGIPIHL